MMMQVMDLETIDETEEQEFDGKRSAADTATQHRSDPYTRLEVPPGAQMASAGWCCLGRTCWWKPQRSIATMACCGLT